MGQIREGASTRAEIEKIFGRPESVMVNPEKRTLTFHSFARAEPELTGFLFGPLAKKTGDLRIRTLSILYDTNNIVAKFLFSEALPEYKDGFAGVRIGKEITEEDLSWIRRGQTTYGEIVERLGSPVYTTLNFEGKKLAFWGHAKLNYFTGSRADELGILFNENEQVEDFARGNSAIR